MKKLLITLTATSLGLSMHAGSRSDKPEDKKVGIFEKKDTNKISKKQNKQKLLLKQTPLLEAEVKKIDNNNFQIDGRNAFHYAIDKQDLQEINKLLNLYKKNQTMLGEKLLAQTSKSKETPLHLAVYKAEDENGAAIVKAIIAASSDNLLQKLVGIENFEGQKPHEIAEEKARYSRNKSIKEMASFLKKIYEKNKSLDLELDDLTGSLNSTSINPVESLINFSFDFFNNNKK